MFETMVMHLNSGGAWFCGWAWSMLWQSSVVIAVLLVLDMVLKNRVRATVRYALWALVLVKLVLPPSLCVPTGVGYWCNVERAVQAGRPETTAGGESEIRISKLETRNNPQISNSENAQNVGGKWGQTPEEKGSGPISPAVTWQGAIFLLWAAGVLVLVVLLVQRMLFVRGLIAQSRPAEGRLRETMEKCRLQAGVRENIDLQLTENMLSPAACGLARPVVLMPKTLLESLSRERVRAVLIHELMHIRRKDLWVNMAQSLVQIAYFYNPLVWLANARIRAVREQAVDEAALANLGDEASEYGRTLVAVAEVAFSRPHFSLGLVGVVESKKSLAMRIRHITRMGIPKSTKIGLAGILAVIVVGLVLVPMASAKASVAEFVIKGKVTDGATGKPVAGARIGDDGYAGGKQWTTSDANGNYQYLTWYEEHNINCSAPGYKTKKDILLTKVLGSEKERVLNFELGMGVEQDEMTISDANTTKVVYHSGKESISSTSAWQNAAEEQFTKKFSVSTGGKLTVDVDFGSITVSAGDGNEVTVDVWRKVGRRSVAEAQTFLSEHPVQITQDGNTVKVEAEHEKDNSWFKGIRNRNEAKYVISVPAKFNAKLGTSGGSVTVSDLTGAVTAETSGGGLKFTRIQGALNGETSGGSISVMDCAGAIKVETSGGGIGVTGGSGTLTGGTSGGSVKVKNFQGNTRIETSGSGITIENVVGEIHGETSGGGISVVLPSPLAGAIHLETSGGGITMSVHENSAFDLDAETSGGSVKCDLPVTTTGEKERNQLKGKVNGGGKSVKLETSGGSIRVKKL